MKKNEIMKDIKTRAEEAGVKLTTADLNVVLDSIYATIINAVAEGDKVKLNEVTYSLRDVPERRGISQMGEKKQWVKPAHKEICVRATKAFKNAFVD